MAAAYTDAEVPWVVIKAQMCNYFSCLPTELDAQPADEIMRLWRANNLFESTRAKRAEHHRG